VTVSTKISSAQIMYDTTKVHSKKMLKLIILNIF